MHNNLGLRHADEETQKKFTKKKVAAIYVLTQIKLDSIIINVAKRCAEHCKTMERNDAIRRIDDCVFYRASGFASQSSSEMSIIFCC